MLKFLFLLLAITWALPTEAALKWQYRSNSSTQAYYATGWRDMSRILYNGAVTLTSGGTGTFGGTYLDTSDTLTNHNLFLWPGDDNCPLGTSGWTILMRLIPHYTGTPGANVGLLTFGTVKDFNQGSMGGVGILVDSSGLVRVTGGFYNGSGANYFNSTAIGSTPLSATSGTATDVWITWDGSTGSGKVKLYQAANGASPTLLGTASASNAQTAMPRAACNAISTQSLPDAAQNPGKFSFNEIAIWDDAEDPTTYGTRSTFITPPSAGGAAYEGYSYTSLSVGNVLSGVPFGPGPGSQTGTYAGAATTDVKVGVSYGGGTGSYDGSDRWTCPAATDLVSTASALKCNSTSTNRTGTYASPATTDVKHGVAYGPASGSTGSYRGADLWSDPGHDNVLSTAGSYLADGTTLTGRWVKAPINKVQDGYSYGVLGTSLTGTLLSTDPLVANVGLGVTYYINNTLYTGTYVPSGTIDPGVANVRVGTGYALDGIVKVGTLTLPTVDKVKVGTAYDDGSTIGTLTCTDPGQGNVADGIGYQVYSVSKTGTRTLVTNVLKQATLAPSGAGTPALLQVTQGDTATLQFKLYSDAGVAFDLTGAVYTTYIKNADGTNASFGNSQHTTDDASGGTMHVVLTSANTSALKKGGPREVVVKVVQGSLTTTFHGAVLRVLQSSPAQ